MSLEAAILIGAALIAVAIVYGSWCVASIAASIAALTNVFEHAFSAGTHWVDDKELEEYHPPDPAGVTFTEHLPPWSDPSAVEVLAWHLDRIVSTFGRGRAPTTSTTEPPTPVT